MVHHNSAGNICSIKVAETRDREACWFVSHTRVEPFLIKLISSYIKSDSSQCQSGFSDCARKLAGNQQWGVSSLLKHSASASVDHYIICKFVSQVGENLAVEHAFQFLRDPSVRQVTDLAPSTQQEPLLQTLFKWVACPFDWEIIVHSMAQAFASLGTGHISPRTDCPSYNFAIIASNDRASHGGRVVSCTRVLNLTGLGITAFQIHPTNWPILLLCGWKHATHSLDISWLANCEIGGK